VLSYNGKNVIGLRRYMHTTRARNDFRWWLSFWYLMVYKLSLVKFALLQIDKIYISIFIHQRIVW